MAHWTGKSTTYRSTHQPLLRIRNVCKRFIAVCRQLNLFSQATVAIDGSKFKAVNSRNRNFTPGKIGARQQQIEQRIPRYLDSCRWARAASSMKGRDPCRRRTK